MAYFDLQEKYGDGWEDIIYENNKKGVEKLCSVLQVLSEQGELMRRALGYDPEETFKAEDGIKLFRPKDLLLARTIILSAVETGMSTSDEEEVDVTLVELKKKTP